MRRHTQELVLPYTIDQVFDLVADIKRYPDFVKWITALRVSQVHEEGPVHQCIGEAVIAFKGFTQTFATKVIADSAQKLVTVDLERGPFRHLVNTWRFIPEEEQGTRVLFHIEYEFSNFVLRSLARANHDYAIKQIMDTFLTEAKRRYADQANPPT